MAKLLQTLIPILAFLLAAATTTRSQTTQFYIDFNGIPNPLLVYQGDAHFPPDSSNLRLTKTSANGNALGYSAGRAVYSQPINFWEDGAKPDLETTIKFIIRPNSGDSNPADGITFFIEPVGAPIGAAGGSFGEFDSTGKKANTFAFEFDIFINEPIDPPYRHIGIDIESIKSVSNTTIDDDVLGKVVTARINYEEARNLITAHVDVDGGGHYEVSCVKDLTQILNQNVQVGISGATGGQVAVHDVMSWHFISTLVHTGVEGGIREVV